MTTYINQKGDEFANQIDVTAIVDTEINVYGLGGDDVIIVRGQSNRPTDLFGGGGDDVLRVSELGLHGKWEGMFLDGGAGDDIMIGGINDETFVVSQVGDVVRDDSASDGDGVLTTLGSYRLPDFIEHLSYEAGRDFKGYGNAGNNLLRSSSGNDLLRGFAGDDRLYGGQDGNDTLVGGLGADELNASWAQHSVTLQYNRTADSRGMFGTDVVMYMGANDRIDLSRIDADTSSPGRNEAFTFIGTEGFGTDATGQVRYERLGYWNTVVLVSTDADPAAEMRIIFESPSIAFAEAMFIL